MVDQILFFGTRATAETFGCFVPNSQFEEYFASCTQNFEQLVFFLVKQNLFFIAIIMNSDIKINIYGYS